MEDKDKDCFILYIVMVANICLRWYNKIDKEGKAYMSGADCPDKLCVKQKAISKKGESIVCLPHKLVVQVTDGSAAEVDAIAG